MRAQFPLYVSGLPDQGSYFMDQGSVITGTGLIGGVLNLVDACDAWNNPVSQGDPAGTVMVGEVDWCEDIPEWVGQPFGSPYGYHSVSWPCLVGEKRGDATNAAFVASQDAPNLSARLAFPGSADYPSTWAVSYFPDRIAGMEFRLHLASTLTFKNS